MKSLTRLFIVFCACNALALIAFAGPEVLPSGKEMKEVAPMPPPPECHWTGFYIGLNAGGTWSDNNSFDTDGTKIFANPLFPAGSNAVGDALAVVGTNDLSLSTAGFAGGGQIGGNQQIWRFVVGLEADLQVIAGADESTAQSKTTTLAPNFPNENYQSTVHAWKSSDYLGTVRGRVGFLVTSKLLAYATGGLAYGGVNARTSFDAVESLGNPPYPPVFGHSRFSDLRGGWAAGGGLEWLFACHWSLKVEDLYYDLGSVDSKLTLTQINTSQPGSPPWGVAAVRSTTWFNGNIARVGLNFHF
jgi:outer membrane immunogenic protein